MRRRIGERVSVALDAGREYGEVASIGSRGVTVRLDSGRAKTVAEWRLNAVLPNRDPRSIYEPFKQHRTKLPPEIEPGDLFRSGAGKGKLVLAVSIRSLGESTAIEFVPFSSRTGRPAPFRGDLGHPTTWLNPRMPIRVYGLYAPLKSSTVPIANQPISKEEKMATTKTGKRVVKRGAKSDANKAGAKATVEAAKSNGRAPKRTAADLDKLVKAFVKHLQSGETMRALKAEHGFSSDVPIREALLRNGFDSKGNPYEIEKITATGAALGKRLVKERASGKSWYELSLATGKPESELREAVEKAGGSTARVYPSTPKAEKAKTPAANKAKTSANDKADSAPKTRKTSGKKTSRAAKGNPSKTG